MCRVWEHLFFHACSKLKVPAFLGSSFVIPRWICDGGKLGQRYFCDMTMGEKLPYACGGIVVAGALYLILALIIKLAGVEQANIVKLARELFDDETLTQNGARCQSVRRRKDLAAYRAGDRAVFWSARGGPAPFNP